MNAGKAVRADIAAIVDSDSFVELSAFSFSQSEFYQDGAAGEGVVTGFATVGGYPFYIVAQNAEVLSGGLSAAGCEKIVKCLDSAEKSRSGVIYLLHSKGVRVGEGVGALEGAAKVLLRAAQLKGSVMQFAVICGEVYGHTAALAGICDFNFFIKERSVLAALSPLVIAAKSGINSSAREIGGEGGLGKSNLVTFTVDGMAEVRGTVIAISDVLSAAMTDSDELNVTIPELDSDSTYKTIKKLFDGEAVVEVGAGFCPGVKCVLGRIGGIAAACVVFDGAEGQKLNVRKVRKIRDFAEFACCHNLPLVNFVNCIGVCPRIENHDSLLLKEISSLIDVLDCCDKKIAVVTGKAIGLGYTLFAAKGMGYDYSYAFATAKIALFNDEQGAEIEFGSSDEKLKERYAEERSDPFNAAKGGYTDNVIRPAFAKQYLAASLQMLLK